MRKIYLILLAGICLNILFYVKINAQVIYQGSGCEIQFSKSGYAYYNGTHYIVWSNGYQNGNYNFDNWVKLSTSSDSVNWTTQNLFQTIDGSANFTLGIDNNGKIHIAYNERVGSSTNWAVYWNMMYADNVSGTWSDTIITLNNGTYFTQPARIIISNDTIRLFYNQNGWYKYGGALYVMKYIGKKWGKSILVSSNGTGNGADDTKNMLQAYDFKNNNLILYVSNGYTYNAGNLIYGNTVYKITESGNNYAFSQTYSNTREVEVHNGNMLQISGDTKSVYYNGLLVKSNSNAYYSYLNFDPVSNKISFYDNNKSIGFIYNNFFNAFKKADSIHNAMITLGNSMDFLDISNTTLETNLLNNAFFKSPHATDVNCSSATLNCNVFPDNLSDTVSFEYGLTSDYGDTISALPAPVSGDNYAAVSAVIYNLNPGTTYHYRLKLLNSAFSVYSKDTVFTTLPAPAYFDLVSPNKGANTNVTPEFIWNESAGASFYQLFINDRLIKDSIYGNSYQLSQNDSLTNCMNNWTVIAKGNGCETGSNETYSFTLNRGNIYSLDGYVTYDNSISSPLVNVSLTLKDTERVLGTTTTDSTGHYVFNNLNNGTYSLVVSSNNKVGGINPLDALFLNRVYIRLYNFPDALKEKAADVNADGKISPLDALLINRFYIGLVKVFPAGKWVFDNQPFYVSCGNTTQNCKGLCVGDVNGSFKP